MRQARKYHLKTGVKTARMGAKQNSLFAALQIGLESEKCRVKGARISSKAAESARRLGICFHSGRRALSD